MRRFGKEEGYFCEFCGGELLLQHELTATFRDPIDPISGRKITTERPSCWPEDKNFKIICIRCGKEQIHYQYDGIDTIIKLIELGKVL